MSPSLRYLHFFAISSHSSGPPPFAGAGPPISPTLILEDAAAGVAKLKSFNDESDDRISNSDAEDDALEGGRGRKDGRSFLRGMVATVMGDSALKKAEDWCVREMLRLTRQQLIARGGFVETMDSRSL